MKKLFIGIIICVVIVSTLFISSKVQALLSLSGKIIVVDVGHGGKDPGTSSNNILEKDINLKIGGYLEIELAKLGASVVLTRDGDYDLSSPNAYWRKKSDFDNRINLINNSKADLYLSIHLNYLDNSVYSGAQIFYSNDDNKKIADVIQSVMNKELNSDRESKKIPSKTYMYSKLKIPGVLIECGFLSNDVERNKLNTKEYQQKIANIIAIAVSEYFNT